MAQSKSQLLQTFIEDHSHLPEQGTDEWKEARLNRIGGSELSSVLKLNKNKSTSKLILEKLGFDRFVGNVITHWGNVFEELIRRYTEDEFKCRVYETGSIPYHDGFLSYSPDGLGIVSKDIIKEQLSKNDLNIEDVGLSGDDIEYLTLFEFKCPHSRLPTNEIPIHYVPQITVGMNIINIMEVGMFIQAVYRRCQFIDIAYNTLHNGYGHFKRASIEGTPKETGFMVFYCDDVEYVNELIDVIEQVTDVSSIDGVIDIGSIYNSEVFETVMEACVSKKIKVDYNHRFKYNETVFNRDGMTQAFYNVSLQYKAKKALRQVMNEYTDRIVGILPYKLLDVYIIPVQKQHEYITESGAYESAKSVVNCINEHRNIGCLDKKEVMKSIKNYKL